MTAGMAWGTALAAVPLLAATACGGDKQRPDAVEHNSAKHTITGDLVLRAGDRATSGCTAGLGGYTDIRIGAQVTVTDGTGAVLGLGTLVTGVREGSACRFTLSPIDNVPEREFYGVEVAHRGVVKFSRSDMQTKDWRVTLTLG